MEIEGGAALVTGASSGIGAAAARALARRGCNVAVGYRVNEEGAAETVAACRAAGVDAVAVQGDVAEDADCRAIARAACDRWGRIDALVNNAGVTRFVDAFDLEALTAGDFVDAYAVNVVGAFQMSRAAAPEMKAAGAGAIVNVSSFAASNGTGSSIAYTASKGAVNTLTLSLARALAPEIRVNCVAPALTDTRWNRAGLGDDRYERVRARFVEEAPLKAVIEAGHVADAILWLIAGADRTTGEILRIGAGAHLG